ncbi:pentapeptide repeat-containing protein [Polyangium jinanense]|uniref:Pentapeptide repeat-containing protein n=1 Tax=Polyangium jinanense TaxID=2829994 RepID=A0A9X3X453_9BACT|nr:pentapeptide repeat-containing protein [Polyangium jinanense]MDC3956284.1 pentapeptide repeat-containing protein [Polyangium jinanense]MDC3982420.1 pentapeptide repeat-containing protein [Polyangium jinanense]
MSEPFTRAPPELTAQLVQSNFTRVKMEEAELRSASGPRAVFVKTTLDRARFDGVRLPDADVRRAHCIEAVFADAERLPLRNEAR